MYASYTFTVLSKIYEKANIFYEYSLLKRVFIKIKSFFKWLSAGSLLVAFLTHESTILESSFLFKIYCLIVDTINKLFKSLNIFFIKNIKESYSYKLIIKRINKYFANSRTDFENIIKNSYLFKFIIYMFTLDEDDGGEKWW
ncbi:hypothetical protein Y919_05625 [Caloranaerobacter azorensis H53214]|uniref:Uncharacterized protein n=2 Tax=Caloranaerobacter azorensis TaxID=116090 RepID=A0A1M5TK89_9FIRM|nr:hypothetical protein [Caloranaerobacter azorensis]KGG80516.1 hypothetical protein Y919_05625 [Caloranaerobacter azorensis H53214]SHH51091.1 hypothetical protein SAMN02745135_01033 [Caloranaerobacter azorensis DSM 13643]